MRPSSWSRFPTPPPDPYAELRLPRQPRVATGGSAPATPFRALTEASRVERRRQLLEILQRDAIRRARAQPLQILQRRVKEAEEAEESGRAHGNSSLAPVPRDPVTGRSEPLAHDVGHQRRIGDSTAEHPAHVAIGTRQLSAAAAPFVPAAARRLSPGPPPGLPPRPSSATTDPQPLGPSAPAAPFYNPLDAAQIRDIVLPAELAFWTPGPGFLDLSLAPPHPSVGLPYSLSHARKVLRAAVPFQLPHSNLLVDCEASEIRGVVNITLVEAGRRAPDWLVLLWTGVHGIVFHCSDTHAARARAIGLTRPARVWFRAVRCPQLAGRNGGVAATAVALWASRTALEDYGLTLLVNESRARYEHDALLLGSWEDARYASVAALRPAVPALQMVDH